MADEKLKCAFCSKVLAKSSNQDKKDIEIRCPKCKKILLAYFKTDEFIPVWKYDGNNENKYDSKEDRRFYHYRVFYAGCGIMGIEHKEHNSTQNGCSYEIYQCYNLIESVNSIFKKIEDDINLGTKTKEIKITLLPEDFDKKKGFFFKEPLTGTLL